MANAIERNLYGTGFSPLSISNKKYAEAQEMLANKENGLFAIYQEDGSVVSAEYLTRCKEHLKDVIAKCQKDGTVGKIFKIRPDDKLVQSVKSTTNLFNNQIDIYTGYDPFTFLRLDMDVDCFHKNDLGFFDPENVTITMNFTLKVNDVEHSYEITEKLLKLNQMAYLISYDDFDGEYDPSNWNVYGFRMNSINVNMPNVLDSNTAFIVQDILFVLH